MVRFAKSAFKHGISAAQIDDVLRSENIETFDEGYSQGVGFDGDGNLLEIKVQFGQSKSFDVPDNVSVFHADKATKKYQKAFNERKRK